MASTTKAEYLPFLDGLRAIAVLAVVSYHIAPTAFPGGYIGVDVFFVISGYLIINQIISGLNGGTFTFSDFWSRRALRILPPYMVVIGASLLIGSHVLVTANEFESFGYEVLFSSIMGANFYYLMIQGYFDTAAHTKPLLHLWSLAVEEQFYVIAPVLIGAVYWMRLRPRVVAAYVALLFFASLIGCILFTSSDRNYAFYLVPLRAWEFMAGGLVPLLTIQFRRLPTLACDLLTAGGCTIIFVCVFAFSPGTPFPSYWAALPVLGSSMVIAGGCASPRGVVARALALRPLVFIGLVSYAWYLWHWPLITFGRIYNYGEAGTLIDILTGGAIAFALAIATHLGVERPIRRYRSSRTKQLTWKPAVVGLFAVVSGAAAGGFLLLHTSPNLAREQADNLSKATPRVMNCWLAHSVGDHSKCFAGAQAPIGLLLGDSYAATAFVPMAAAADVASSVLAVAASSACAPLIGGQDRPPCKHLYEVIRRTVADNQIDYAILFSRWVIYTPWTVGVADGYRLPLVGDALPKQLFVESLKKTIATLSTSGVKRILIIAPIPEFDRSAPECYYRAMDYGKSIDDLCSTLRSRVEERRSETMAWLFEATADHPNVRIADPLDIFCDSVWCRPYDEKGVLYMDSNHLRHVGTRKLIHSRRDDFAWVFNGQPRHASE